MSFVWRDLSVSTGVAGCVAVLLGPQEQDTPAADMTAETGVHPQLKLDQMVPGMSQPRTRMDEGALYGLAESIKAQDLQRLIKEFGLTHEAAAQAGVAHRHRLRCSRSMSGLLKPEMYSVAPTNSNQKELKKKISKKIDTSRHDVR